jgi:hypothetical protein
MSHQPHGLGPQLRSAIVALGLVTAVMALATSGSTGHRSDATIGQAPAPSASRSVRSAPIAVSASGDQPRSMVPDRTATPNVVVRKSPAPTPRPAAVPFAINLFNEGDFVSQRRVDWCVPASILAMINMIDPAVNRRPPAQRELDRLARRLSTWRLRGAGSEPEGWARTLNRLGYGPYEVRAERTRAAAIASAARALRLTGRPVGLLVWRGAHAWVVSGFRATADPAGTDAFAVTHLSVLDPWYPRDSSIWGPSRRPNATISVRRVAKVYLAWRRPAMRYPEKDGRFVLVIPVADTAEVQADPS